MILSSFEKLGHSFVPNLTKLFTLDERRPHSDEIISLICTTLSESVVTLHFNCSHKVVLNKQLFYETKLSKPNVHYLHSDKQNTNIQ